MKGSAFLEKTKHFSMDVSPESPLSEGTTLSAAYRMTHVKSGMYYFGSAGDIHKRRHKWLSYLRLRTCHHKKIQELYDSDNRFHFHLYLVENREEALALEQEFIDRHRNDPMCLNQAPEANKPPPHLRHRDDVRKRISESLKGKPKTGKSLEAIRSRNEAASKKVSINSVVYPSIAAAARALGMWPATVGEKIRGGKDANWKYV